MFSKIKEDIKTIYERDPAAKNMLEIILCYPGLHAIIFHRIGHWFYIRKLFLVARIISQISRFFTGIEIHPGAKLGRRIFIDHGMGVVIGETTEIGDDVTIYQGVTLGGTGKEEGKRHPTIGNNVMISSGAKVLGPFKVNDHAKIGAGAVVLNEVPSYSTIVGVPGRIVIRRKNTSIDDIDLDQVKLPDPVAEQLKCMQNRIRNLEEKLRNEEENDETI
ncbi:serine O-acetyltransferase [Clostridium sp. D2Q-14]|uniref:serine O-acetyltransferase n=1 Tax=Anaeromonas gelatinilytica TaxID=2683194 RepID=UPI00193BC34A|nr:serine O-acetyltransferase [Anaeromonas gelatinilytica]MBS4534018.1 serine O-acetyltransferase [Anaeromonas gelatinilytica]